jgi:hypothetical protein
MGSWGTPECIMSDDRKLQEHRRERYEAPAVTTHGTLEHVTQGARNGTILDADFPAGTPADSITFS